MKTRYEDALVALRQIQRQTEYQTRQLAQTSGLTPSQVMVLQALEKPGRLLVGDIARLTRLGNPTVTSLSEKMRSRGLISRERDNVDRRRVWLVIQPDGRRVLETVPQLLQDTFGNQFSKLVDWEQAMIVSALERVVTLLGANMPDSAPILDFVDLDQKP